MLHLLTIAFHYPYLTPLYDSIPKEADIRWWICYPDNNNRPQFDDSRITAMECSNEDMANKWGGTRSNAVFSVIPDDGQFHILDEDTLFHPNLYQGFEGLVIANQMCADGRLRLRAGTPTRCCIDTGSCLSHSSVLKHVQWSTEKQPDFVFWDECAKFFGEDKVKYVYEPISLYNAQVKN